MANSFKRPYQPDSYYVTLNSSSSQEYYPNNRNNGFINNLVSPIPLESSFESGGTLEVGVVEVFCQPKDKNPPKIFGHSPNDNQIIVTKRLKSEFFFEKKPERIEQYFFQCNDEFKKLNLKIQFIVDVEIGVKKLILVNGELGYNLKISEPYNSAFGFINSFYSDGSHKAEEPYSQKEFDLIDITKHLHITLFKDQTFFANCQEPEKLEVVSLVSEINKCLTPYKVSVIYDGIDFEFESELASQMVKFPTIIEKIFGIPKDYWFKKVHEILRSYSNIDLGVSSNFLIMKTNLIEAQPFNSKLLNALRMFPRPEKTEKTVHFLCTPVLYVPVANIKTIEKIEVEFCDERLQPAALVENTDTIVVLHFRSKLF